MFVNNRPVKDGEEEYAVIKLTAKDGKFNAEFTLSHTPDATKGENGVTFVQAAAATGFHAIKTFVDEQTKGQDAGAA